MLMLIIVIESEIAKSEEAKPRSYRLSIIRKR